MRICPACNHADGKHREDCKIKLAYDKACVPHTVVDLAVIAKHRRVHGTPEKRGRT
jgi:hypothetical protein